MRDILFSVIAMVCIVRAFPNPTFGMLTFVVFGMAFPQSYTWGFARSFPFGQFLAGTTILGYMLGSKPKQFPKEREAYLMMGLWVTFAISTVFVFIDYRNEYFVLAAKERMIQVSKIYLMVFFCMAIIDTEEKLHLLLRAIAISLGVIGLKGGIFSIVTAGQFMVLGPANSFLFANNAIGLALAMNVPLLFYLSRIEPYVWLKWAMRIMMVFTAPAVVCTYSRGAWLGLAAAGGIIGLRLKNKFLIGTGCFMLLIIALPFLSTKLVPDRVSNRFDDLKNYETEGSAQSRFWNWEFCRRVGFAYPLTGAGFRFYGPEMYQLHYPEYLEFYGEDKTRSCHSMWFTVLGEHGVIAALLWLGLVGTCLLSVLKIQRFGKRRPDRPIFLTCAHAVSTALIVFMVCGTFLDTAYYDFFYYLVAAIVVAKNLMRKESSLPDPPRRSRDVTEAKYGRREPLVGATR